MRVHEAVAELVLNLDPTTLGLALSVLKEDHPMVIAARLGLEIRDRRQAEREAEQSIGSSPEWLAMRAGVVARMQRGA